MVQHRASEYYHQPPPRCLPCSAWHLTRRLLADHQAFPDRPAGCAEGFVQEQVGSGDRRRTRYREGSQFHYLSRNAQAQFHQAIAHAFALAGASDVVITARSLPELEATREEILSEPQLSGSRAPKILVQVTDVTSEESVKALFDRLDQEGVEIDVLVNNAGKSRHQARPQRGSTNHRNR